MGGINAILSAQSNNRKREILVAVPINLGGKRWEFLYDGTRRRNTTGLKSNMVLTELILAILYFCTCLTTRIWPLSLSIQNTYEGSVSTDVGFQGP